MKVKIEWWEFSSWSELQAIDRKTRKLFTIYAALHPKSDAGRLYIPRKEGGRGLISIEDCAELSIRGLESVCSWK